VKPQSTQQLMRSLAVLQYRWHAYKSIREAIDNNEGGLDKFSQGYKCGSSPVQLHRTSACLQAHLTSHSNSSCAHTLLVEHW
jgi:hypothetical protein